MCLSIFRGGIFVALNTHVEEFYSNFLRKVQQKGTDRKETRRKCIL